MQTWAHLEETVQRPAIVPARALCPRGDSAAHPSLAQGSVGVAVTPLISEVPYALDLYPSPRLYLFLVSPPWPPQSVMTVCEGRDDGAAGCYNGDVLLFPDMLLFRQAPATPFPTLPTFASRLRLLEASCCLLAGPSYLPRVC